VLTASVMGAWTHGSGAMLHRRLALWGGVAMALGSLAGAVGSRFVGGRVLLVVFALMATAGELPKDRILDIARSVGLDAARLEKDMADPAVLDSIKQSNALADKLHFDGTPTFVINDKIVVGELTDAQLQSLTAGAPKG